MSEPRNRGPRARRAALFALAAAMAFSVAVPATAAGAAKKPRAVVRMSPGELTVYKVGNEPQALPDDVRDGVMATLTQYVNAATVKPLRKGVADDAALGVALTPVVTARLASADRGVLVDEGMPKSVSTIKVKTAPVALSGLADGDGRIVVVTAGIDATVKTKTKKGNVEIKRAGELVLTPSDTGWKISGYTLVVDRLGKGLGPTATTTTAPAAPGGDGPTASAVR